MWLGRIKYIPMQSLKTSVQETISRLSDEELSQLLETGATEYPDDTVHLARLEAYKRWGSILPRVKGFVLAQAFAETPRPEMSPAVKSIDIRLNKRVLLIVLGGLAVGAVFFLGVQIGSKPRSPVVKPVPVLPVPKHEQEEALAQKNSPQQIFESLNKAVVLVRWYDAKNKRIGFVTGFNIASDGLIVFPLHALRPETASADVVFPANGALDVVGLVGASSEFTDLGFLKLDGADLPVVKDSSSRWVKEEDKIFILSNPHGLMNSLVGGDIRTILQDFGVKSYELRVPEGSIGEGGLLLDERGRAIGVCTHPPYCLPAEEMESIKPFGKVVPIKNAWTYLKSGSE